MIGKLKIAMTRQAWIWVLSLGLGVPQLYAGGFYLSVEKAEQSSDPKAKGALMIVRPYGCHEAEKAVVSGTAKGSVNGKQQIVALRFTPLTQPGTYAVHRNWPVEGEWVLTITAKHGARTTNASVTAGP